MPNCNGVTDDLWVQYHHTDSMKKDLEDVFGDDDMFRNMDFSSFNIEDFDPSVFDSTYDSEDDSDGEYVNSRIREIRNHDCMWGGQCCNKEFQRSIGVPVPAPKPPPPPVAPTVPAVPATTPSVLITCSDNKVVTIVPASERTDSVVVLTNNRTVLKQESRSLLLNRTNMVAPVPSPAKTPIKREILTPQSSRPDTPQSEDDDLTNPIPIDTHNTTSIFRSALDAISTPQGDWSDDDEEEFEYTEVKRTKPQTSSQTEIWRLSASAKSDHNYDGSSKNIKLEGLGVDTPSDSEEDEEIDVVSLSDRSSSSRSSSCGGALPTRPTPRDQEHLEEITTSLLSASEAVSRKLKKTFTVNQVKHNKRKKYQESESSDCDYDDDDDSFKYQQRQTKKQKCSSTPGRRKKSSRFSSEEGCKDKRDIHNKMEKMRRIDLKNSFEELKALVPGLSNKDRAAKVVILREAANYCFELGAEAQSKVFQKEALKKEQERLRSMVSSLRKAAAMAKQRY